MVGKLHGRRWMWFGLGAFGLVWLFPRAVPEPAPADQPTPLGLLGSRAVYWRSETDWHYGQGPRLSMGRPRLSRPTMGMPPWGPWLNGLDGALQPSKNLAHRSGELILEQGRNSTVRLLMEWALRLDPTYTRVYLDKSYIEDREENSPRQSEQTLLQGLARVHDPESRTALLVNLFFLRYYRLHHFPEARALKGPLMETLRGAEGRLSEENTHEAQACLYLTQSLEKNR